MIRPEVEKPRGFVFTGEGLRDVTLPVIPVDPCKEEDFEDFKQNIRAQLDRLESRIAKIEIIRSEET